jgi:tetratricopeptide (TPR) repeat protein
MRCWWSRTDCLAVALLLATAAPLIAQSPSDRAALAALQDSLDTADTPVRLAAIPRDWTAATSPAMTRLRRGFHALALGRLSQRRGDLDRALVEFDWAITAARHWPYPWFGRGVAKLALSEGGFRVKPLGGQPFGRNFYVGFTEDLVAAFEREPDFEPGVALLLELLPHQGDRAQPPAFVRALELAAARRPTIDPAAHLILGRAHRTASQEARALDAFDRFEAAGGDPSTAALERARSLAGLGRLDAAAAAYLRGAELDAEATRHVYRRDLAWVAADSELVTFDSVPPNLLSRWISDFWAIRDAEAVRRPGERLREHLRRWSHAYRRFRVVDPERKTDFRTVMNPDIGPCKEGGAKSIDNLTFEDPARLQDARRRERLLDHRGVVYMRHGEPAARIQAPGARGEIAPLVAGPATPPRLGNADAAQPSEFPDATESVMEGWDVREVWQYWFDGAIRLMYFSGSLALGRSAPSTLYSYIPLDANLLYRVAALDPRYRPVAFAAELERAGMRRAGPVECMTSRMALRRENRDAMIASVETDSYTLLFPAPLDPILQAAAVGQPSDGTGRLLVIFAVPGDRLTPEPIPGAGVRYRLGIRISAVDRQHQLIHGIDSLRSFVARDTIRAGAFLTGLVEVPVPAGAYTVRVAVYQTDERAGSAQNLGTVGLGSERGALGMSDLLLERESGGLRWDNRGTPVMLNALNAYATGDAAPVFYEAYGLEPGRSYETTLSVRKATGDGDRGVSLVFNERADRPTMQIRRTIGLEDLDPGQYRLTLSIVEEGSGARASRSRLINVTPR